MTGTNLFVYCLNQPVNRADYDGLASMDVCDSELHVGPDDSPGDNYDGGGGGGFYGGSGYTYSASVINDTFPTEINSGYNTHFNAESFSNLLDTAANMLVSCNFAFDNVGAAASQAVSCFAEGTLVLREDGPAEIEDVRVGDLVWATDPETGETALKRVVRIFRNETYEWLHLTVNGEEIICTQTHPFYSPVKGWIAACELKAGDILVTLNGEYVVLEVIQHELLESPEITYNFEVEDFHTYYVGAISVLVHNMCKPQSPSKVDDNYLSHNNIDAHAFKNKAGGISKSQVSKYDIYQDTANKGKLWVGDKSGKIWKGTAYYFEDLSNQWRENDFY